MLQSLSAASGYKSSPGYDDIPLQWRAFYDSVGQGR